MAKTIILSAIVLAKNEQECIETCLRSVSWADEIVVIDNGSDDNTVGKVRKYTSKIYSIPDFDFSVLRNTGMQKARGTWLLYVDADEEITGPLKQEIQQVMRTYEFSKPSAYYIKRKNYYLGKPWPTQDQMQRLFYRDHLIEWYGPLHETAKVKGPEGVLKHPLIHRSHKTLSSMIVKTNAWSDLEAQLRFKSGHPQVRWWRFPRVWWTGFFDSYIRQKGYMAKTTGLIESMYQGFSMCITYAKLWELQRQKKE